MNTSVIKSNSSQSKSAIAASDRSAAKRRPVTSALLVDDDPFMLEVVSDMLRKLGVPSVVTALNGAAGISAYDRAANKPDLVVCDLGMPVTDGFELMELLSARRFTGGVILTSGMDERTLKSATLMAKFHRLQFLATLKKPIDRAALGAAIDALS